MPTDLRKARELFLHAVGKLPPEQWNSYVAKACDGDADLEQQVGALLQVHLEAGSFLDTPAPGLTDTLDLSMTEQPGAQIGPYKLLQQIGEGGMGTVFLAEQHEPVRRKVALKVIKPGMDSRQVIARFDAERQALSLMDHPNIAKVLDAGTTNQGRPYFVMELVKGQPMTAYCDQHQLTPRQRLELFVTACHAIQHAHQKGVIHRDIKPSNVLVAEYDDRPVCKVIDFGVAKALNQPLTEQSMFTGLGQILGTLEYMSPEQAKVNQLDIDTRSDVYSLGVLLYELLTGTTPFNKQRLGSAAWDEMLRIIREEEPPKPSTRLSDSHDSLASISALRHTEPAKLTKLVRGELDWIVMKALEKDRARRYETANGLAMDIQRYLVDEPVQACPPSNTYRLRKFARKHKAGVGFAIAATIFLMSGIAGLAISNSLIRREQARTLSALEVAENKEKAAAASEARTQAVLDFVEEHILAAARPVGEAGGLGKEVTLRQAIEASLPFVEKSFPEDPEVETTLRRTVGQTFMYLGEFGLAESEFRIAHEIGVQHLGKDHADTLASAYRLGGALSALGRSDEALALRQETLSLRRSTLGPNHIDTLKSESALAASYVTFSQYDDACALYEQVLKQFENRLGPDHTETLSLMNDLGICYQDMGRLEMAQKIYKDALAIQKRLHGDDHPMTLSIAHNLAGVFSDLGQYDKAAKLNEEILKIRKVELGIEHRDTLASMSNLANCYYQLDRYDDAIELGERVLTLWTTNYGLDHPETLQWLTLVATFYTAAGRYKEAIQRQQQALSIGSKILAPGHPVTLSARESLARIYFETGLFAEALREQEDVVRLRKHNFPDDHPNTLAAEQCLAAYHDSLGHYDPACALLEKVLPKTIAALGPNHPNVLTCKGLLANVYSHIGRLEDSVRLSEEVFLETKGRFGPDSQSTLLAQMNVAVAYYKTGRLAEALETENDNVTRLRAILGEDHPQTLMAMENLSEFNLALGRYDEALKLEEEVYTRQQQATDANHPPTFSSMTSLAKLYATVNRIEEAQELADKAQRMLRKQFGNEHPETRRCLRTLAYIHWRKDEWADAIQAYGQVLESLNRVSAEDGEETAEVQVELAWCLLAVPDDSLRDVTAAAELISKAAKILPDQVIFLITRALLEYRTGDWQAAVNTMQRARAIDPGRRFRGDGFILAMAYWNLQNKEESRKTFEATATQLKEEQYPSQDVRRLGLEAATLLGINEVEIIAAPKDVPQE